uniref:LAGLIDADG endonuclease n=1 Tax=Morchella brunnea TaxID=1174671 RepID=A0A8K1MII7_9PEZI|nr:LAGLIDADG endonuclease [Morchella brunnea]UBU98507.1 LAGLIDADG endonuclease [Morchella brunnea]
MCNRILLKSAISCPLCYYWLRFKKKIIMLKTKGLLSQGIAFFTFAVILVCLLKFYAFNSLDLAAFLSLNLSQQRFYSSKIPNNKNDNTNKLNTSLSQKDEMHHVRMLSNLNPFYISGFADAESCFSVIICKKKEYKIGWYVILAAPSLSFSLRPNPFVLC